MRISTPKIKEDNKFQERVEKLKRKMKKR